MKKICSVMLVLILVLTSIVATPVEAKSKAKWITNKKFVNKKGYYQVWKKGAKYDPSNYYKVIIKKIKGNKVVFAVHTCYWNGNKLGDIDKISGKIKGKTCSFKGKLKYINCKATGKIIFKKNGTFKMKLKLISSEVIDQATEYLDTQSTYYKFKKIK